MEKRSNIRSKYVMSKNVFSKGKKILGNVLERKVMMILFYFFYPAGVPTCTLTGPQAAAAVADLSETTFNTAKGDITYVF